MTHERYYVLFRGDKFRNLLTRISSSTTARPEDDKEEVTTVVNGRFPPRATKPFKPLNRDRYKHT